MKAIFLEYQMFPKCSYTKSIFFMIYFYCLRCRDIANVLSLQSEYIAISHNYECLVSKSSGATSLWLSNPIHANTLPNSFTFRSIWSGENITQFGQKFAEHAQSLLTGRTHYRQFCWAPIHI